MDLVPLITVVPLAGLVVVAHRPMAPDIRPRVAAELVLILAAGLIGAFVGGSLGSLIATTGIVPALALISLRRRVVRLMTLGRVDALLRTVRWLDVASWPVPDRSFNIIAHRAASEHAGLVGGMSAFLDRERRRPTRALCLARAVVAHEANAIASLASGMLGAENQPEDQFDGLREIVITNLAGAIDWYETADAARIRQRGALAAQMLIITAAGRTSTVGHMAEVLDFGALDSAAVRASAELAAGTTISAALAPLEAFGGPGAAVRARLEQRGIRPQPLDPEREAIVDRMAADVLTLVLAMGRDSGRWRPLLTWSLMAILAAGYVRQLVAGPITPDRLYDMGAFATGPDRRPEPWRALTAPYLHASLAHLSLNLMGLTGVGRLAEARLRKWQFLATWFVTSSGSFVLVGMVEHRAALTVGASGGVLGLLGAGIGTIVVNRRRQRSDALDRALRVLLLLVAVQLLLDQIIPNVSKAAAHRRTFDRTRLRTWLRIASAAEPVRPRAMRAVATS